MAQGGAARVANHTRLDSRQPQAVGAGPVFVLSDEVHLRSDLIFQGYSAKFFDFQGQGPGWEGEQGYWFDGYRLWLSLGVELWS